MTRLSAGDRPFSKSDTLKKKQLFEGAMRLRYRVLRNKPSP
jgi:hypothetical protein